MVYKAVQTHTLQTHTLQTHTLQKHTLQTHTLQTHTLQTHTLQTHTLIKQFLSYKTFCKYFRKINVLKSFCLVQGHLSCITLLLINV